MVIDDLSIFSERLLSLIQILSIVLVELVEKLTKDVLRLSLVDFLRTSTLLHRQRHLAFVRLHAAHREHESRKRLLVLLYTPSSQN